MRLPPVRGELSPFSGTTRDKVARTPPLSSAAPTARLCHARSIVWEGHLLSGNLLLCCNQAAPIIHPQDWFYDPANLFMSLEHLNTGNPNVATWRQISTGPCPMKTFLLPAGTPPLSTTGFRRSSTCSTSSPPQGSRVWSAHSLRINGATGAYSISVNSLIIQCHAF